MLSLYLHPNLPAIAEIVLLLSVALTVLVFMFKSRDINNGSVVGMLVLFAWMLSIVGLHAYVTHDLNSTAIPPEKLSLYSTRFPVNSLRSRIMNIPPAKAGGFADAPEGAQSATRADGYFGSTSAVSTAPISSCAG